MGFFTLIESFFFLSLGITFVLIFLMVFHFKQRVEQLENKNEIVLEAYNDLVKQINELKMVCISSNTYPSPPTPHFSDNIIFSTSSPIPIPTFNNTPANTSYYPKIKVEDFVEAEDTDNEDDDEEEEDEEEEEEEPELQSEELFSSGENVNPENTSLEMEEIEINTEEEEILKEEILEEAILEEEKVILEEEKVILGEEKVILGEEILKEEILEEAILEEEKVILEEEKVILEEDILEEEKESEDNEEDIKKMNVQQLRNLVTVKGLSNDASKIKRAELIRLLTANKSTPSLQDLSLLL